MRDKKGISFFMEIDMGLVSAVSGLVGSVLFVEDVERLYGSSLDGVCHPLVCNAVS